MFDWVYSLIMAGGWTTVCGLAISAVVLCFLGLLALQCWCFVDDKRFLEPLGMYSIRKNETVDSLVRSAALKAGAKAGDFKNGMWETGNKYVGERMKFYFMPWAFSMALCALAASLFGTLVIAVALFLLKWAYIYAHALVMAFMVESIAVACFILLMIITRYGRRTHKILRKHMADKGAHK